MDAGAVLTFGPIPGFLLTQNLRSVIVPSQGNSISALADNRVYGGFHVQIMRQVMRPRLFLGILVLPLVFLFVSSSGGAAPEPAKVEIVIRNFTFEFQGGALRPNEPGTILLKNLDKVRHGFTSPFLEEQDVRVESGGVTTYGKGIKGVYIDPGETLEIHFIPARPGSFAFRCDIHPNMKGELLMLSVEGVKG